MGHLRDAERRLAAFEVRALAALLLLMVALSFAQVVMRGLFSAGLLWADTFLRYLVLWVGFLGAGLAAADGKQFAMDAAERVLPPRVLAAAGVVIHLLTAAVCASLAKAAWAFLVDAHANAKPLFAVAGRAVPEWWFWVILPLGFAVLGVHYLLKAALSAEAAAG